MIHFFRSLGGLVGRVIVATVVSLCVLWFFAWLAATTLTNALSLPF